MSATAAPLSSFHPFVVPDRRSARRVRQRWPQVYGDEVDAPTGPWKGRPVREHRLPPCRRCRAVQALDLRPADALLGGPVAVRRPSPDLHEDECRRRAWLHGDDVDLVAADSDVATEDRPAELPEMAGGDSLAAIAVSLPGRRARTCRAAGAWIARSAGAPANRLPPSRSGSSPPPRAARTARTTADAAG